MVDNSSGSSGEVELNLAPIIDCFTVLITYLLVTASFLTLTALDVSIAVTSNPTDQPPPVTDERPMFMTMDLSASGDVILKVSGGDLKQDYDVTVPGQGGLWDSNVLNSTLSRIKERWDSLKEISVNAAPQVKYKDLVGLINETQKTMPKVYISGG